MDSSYAKSGKNDGVLRSIVRKYYNDEDEKTDILSHFTLRLSYSKQRESEQYWWITQEARLLKLRFHCMENDIALDIYNKKSPLSLITSLLSINFPNISESDFQLYKSDLTFLLRKKYRNKNDVLVNNLNNVSHLDFFQLPFEKGAQFLSSKNNLIVKGFIYVYKNELISIIINLFREHLQKSLELYRTAQFYSSSSSSSNSSQANSSQGSSQGGSSQGGSQGGVSFTAFEEDNDERIQPIVKSLSHLTSTTPIDFDVKKEGEGIDISQLDFLSTQSYPLCMKHIHSNLRKSHKLKHTGRMQYGLFLKGIGLSLEESMQFWRLEFTKVMQQKKFDSEGYAYSIRHNYGKEGKLTNYSPYSCAKIIHDSSSQTNGEHAHGCPFKNWDKSQLTSSLRSSGLSSFQIDDIISDLSQFQYQVCFLSSFTY